MNTTTKKIVTSQASSSLLGAVLILSILGSVWMNGMSGMNDLWTGAQNQWNQFCESLSMIQPHRTVFPH